MTLNDLSHVAIDPMVMEDAATTTDAARTIGAANPKAIAELKLGRRLDPTAADFQQTVSTALSTPYERLFDPKYGSPVFAGLRSVFTGTSRAQAMMPLLTSPLLRQVMPIPFPIWWPIPTTDLSYAVPGEFIVDTPSATAPVQGSLADCWLISAMASVAWCNSDAILERTLKDGSGVVLDDGADYEFTFYASPTWSAPKSLRVKDDVPQQNGQYIYACSSVAGETWPANMEKAFIAMRGATGFLEPSSANYNELNFGDPAWAVASLVGRAPWYHNANAGDAWSTINAHCTNGRATLPMTAWTYGTAPSGVSYDGSGIVGNHAYSILGTETSGGQDYIVLRNPWGYHEGLVNVLSGTWQGLTLPGDGVFALRLDAFAQCYAGFGGA